MRGIIEPPGPAAISDTGYSINMHRNETVCEWPCFYIYPIKYRKYASPVAVCRRRLRGLCASLRHACRAELLK